MLSYSPWENLTRNILEMGGRRWSIHRSTQFPIDIECRLHVEPITDRQLGSHPPLAKTDLASTQIRRVSVTNHPERRDILHTKLPSLQTSHPELGFQSFSEYFYFITFFPSVMWVMRCVVCCVWLCSVLFISRSFSSQIIQTLKPHSIQLGQGHCLDIIRISLWKSSFISPSVPS